MEPVRELKFRAWDGERMLRVVNLAVGISSTGGLDYSECEGEADEIVMRDTEKTVFMQYTGLDDRNGKEIYEGDILSYYCLGELMRQGEEVYFQQEVCAFYLRKPSYRGYGNNLSKSVHKIRQYEVIGNIYENPNLYK